MKINYKVGDIVKLVDGVQYVYRGLNRKEDCYVYDPVKPQKKSMFLMLSEKECKVFGYNIGAVPFARKMYVNVKLIKRA